MDTMEKYYLALGRFVDRFSDVEDHMFMALHTTAGLDLEASQALFSGTRVTGAIDFIKRLYEVKKTDLPARVEDVFSQLASINTVRDHILHYGVRQLGNGLQASNQLRVHAERSLKTIPVSPELLESMTHDLLTICTAPVVYLINKHDPAMFTDPNNSRAQAIFAAAQAPWRYKPAQSIKPTQQSNRNQEAQPEAPRG